MAKSLVYCFFLTHGVVNLNVNVNAEFKVTLHEQVRYRGTLQYLKLQAVTQLDTIVKSTMTETVPSFTTEPVTSGHIAAANYQITLSLLTMDEHRLLTDTC